MAQNDPKLRRIGAQQTIPVVARGGPVRPLLVTVLGSLWSDECRVRVGCGEGRRQPPETWIAFEEALTVFADPLAKIFGDYGSRRPYSNHWRAARNGTRATGL